MNIKFILLCLVFFIIGFPVGARLSAQTTPPVLEAYGLPQDPVKSPVPVVKEEWFLTNVSEIIKIKTPEDIEKKRNALIQFIWKGKLPQGKPDRIVKNIDKGLFKDRSEIQSIDFYEFDTHGLKTRVHHFKTSSKNPKNKLIILRSAESSDFSKTPVSLFITFANQAGFDVLVIPSPLSPSDNPITHHAQVPVTDTSSFGVLGLADQNVFFLLENATFSPLQFYFDPLVRSLNFIDEKYNYTSYHLVGMSSGSWFATVYPAIDPRIKTSHAVLPPLPFFIITNSDSKTMRNYEYFHPQLYKIANYPELYVMASYGEGRTYTQLIDLSNPRRYNEGGYQVYGEEVAQRVRALGKGKFILGIFRSTDVESYLFILETIYADIEERKVKVQFS